MIRAAAAVVLSLLVAACRADAPPAAAPSPSSELSPSPSPARPTDPFALAKSYEAPGPEELARRLVIAERALRAPDADATDLEEHGRVQQASYRQIVVNPGWLEQVLAAVPADLHPTVRSNVEAGAELRALTAPREAMPDWRIVAPPPPADLRKYYDDAQVESGVGWPYLAAIHLVETRMGRIRGTSTAGARGPMQFLPQTWERWGSGDIESPRDSIRAAARYLKGHGAPSDMPRALFAYNHSDRYVKAVTSYAEQIRADDGAYLGYYHWPVYYRTTQGDALLPVGWPA
ncbi:MAG: transglycosylase SLT domain-containing protein [Actinomycetota bacterium]